MVIHFLYRRGCFLISINLQEQGKGSVVVSAFLFFFLSLFYLVALYIYQFLLVLVHT
jgi:hypothetical protein